MNRYKMQAVLAVLAVTFSCTASPASRENGEPRPNILVIVVDDQGYGDLSAYAHSSPGVRTPSMDRLATTGVMFTQAYVSAPVCSPSRSGWITGRYQQRFDASAGWKPGLPSDTVTLAEYLKQAGYVTGRIGKNDYGTGYHRMDVPEYPLNHGYDEFLGFSAHAHDFFLLSETVEKLTPDPHGTSAVLGPLFQNQTRKSYKQGYTTEIFTDAAIDFIERHNERSFFLTVSYNAVHHLIHEVPDRYLEKYGVKKIPNYDPMTMGRYDTYYTKYRKIDPITDSEMRRYYLANLSCLDDNIGRLLDSLDRLLLTENTLIMFFSDNGGSPMTGANNRPLRGSKYTLFEGGIRVPFMVSWKGTLPAGQVFPYRISSLDIVPTCLEAVGLTAPGKEKLDGESFLQAIQKKVPTPTESRPLFWQFKDQWAVREGPYKLVRTSDEDAAYKNLRITEQVLQGPKAPKDRPMLFNLADDPAEQSDLYALEPDRAKRLEGLYRTWKSQLLD